MEKMLDLITGEVTKAFIACGYDEKYARVTLSNRPICASTSATVHWLPQREISLRTVYDLR